MGSGIEKVSQNSALSPFLKNLEKTPQKTQKIALRIALECKKNKSALKKMYDAWFTGLGAGISKTSQAIKMNLTIENLDNIAIKKEATETENSPCGITYKNRNQNLINTPIDRKNNIPGDLAVKPLDNPLNTETAMAIPDAKSNIVLQNRSNKKSSIIATEVDITVVKKIKKSTEYAFSMLDDDPKAQHKLHIFCRRYFRSLIKIDEKIARHAPLTVDIATEIDRCCDRLDHLIAKKLDTKLPFFKAQIASSIVVLKHKIDQIENISSRYRAFLQAKSQIKQHIHAYHYRTKPVIARMLDKLSDDHATAHMNALRHKEKSVISLTHNEVKQAINEAESELAQQLSQPKNYTRILCAIVPVCGITPYQACCAQKIRVLDHEIIEISINRYIYQSRCLVNANLLYAAIHMVRQLKNWGQYKNYTSFTKKHGSSIAAMATGKRKNPLFTLSSQYNTTIEFWHNVYKANLLWLLMHQQNTAQDHAYMNVAQNIGQIIASYKDKPLQSQLDRFARSFTVQRSEDR